MLSVLNGRSWNNIVLQQLGPGQLSAMPLKCQNWMIHQLQKLVILNCQKNTTGPAIWQCHGSLTCGLLENDSTQGKWSHVQATKQKWSACGLQTGEWFHAREMISRCCKPQGRFEQIDSLTTDPDWKLQVSSSPPFFWCVVPAHAWQVGFHHAVWSNQSKQLRPEDGNMVLECCR